MTDTSAFPFDILWNQIRRRSWMWLFSRAKVDAAVRMVRNHVSIQLATVLSPLELDLRAEAGRSTETFDEPVVRLRLTPSGDLHVTTECSCHSGSLCEHAAAVLILCGEEKLQRRVVQIARMGNATIRSQAPSGTATSIDNVAFLPNDSPRPRLQLRRLRVARPGGREASIGVAEPLVDYEGCNEPFAMLVRTQEKMWRNEQGKPVGLRRNLMQERLLLTDLTQAGLKPFAEALPELKAEKSTAALLSVPLSGQGIYWAQFIRDVLPALQAEGWSTDVAPDFGYAIREAQEDGWFTELEQGGGGRDWFAFHLGVEIDGERASLVPLLVDCIEQGLTAAAIEAEPERRFLVALPGEGNPVLSVPGRRLLVLLRLLEELLASRPIQKDGALQISRLHAAQLTALDGVAVPVPDDLQALRAQLERFTEMTAVAPPSGLRAELRPYQLEGLSWLQFLREFTLHGVLADDMGLGKTIQTLAHLQIEKASGRMDRPSLIIAPTSVIRNWAREAARFTPGLTVLLLHGDERRDDFKRIGRHDLVVTSYPLLVRDAAALQPVDWHVVVLDEAQNIKNPRSKAALAACDLRARHRLCLTGTPMENHLGELWSLFQFLMPGLLGSSDNFRTYYRTPIERDRDEERQQQLNTRLQPLLLRRTKSLVAKELPPKTEIVQTIEMGPEQSDLYETIRAAMDERVREAIAEKGLEQSHIVVLDALLKLRQVCCHPKLLKMDAAKRAVDSAKMAFLMDELLPELLEEGHRVLVFSQFTEMLGLIEEALRAAGTPFVKLTGDTKDRETPVNRFQKGEVPLFLISLKAGGAGINLTAADTVIHYDPWWNPAVEAQASDRAYRIGQTKPVFVHKLICMGTVEERIVEMQRSKAALVEGLLSGRTDKLSLTPEDIQRLLVSA